MYCEECTISLLRQSAIAQHLNNVEIQQRVLQEMSHLALQGMQEQKNQRRYSARDGFAMQNSLQ
jgi:hypothetical protein